MGKKQADGYYRETFCHGGRQYSARGKTRKEAIEKAALKKKAIEDGSLGAGGRTPAAAWCREWLATYKEGKVGANTLLSYRRYVGLMAGALGDTRMANVTDAQLQRLLNSRAGYSTSEVSHFRQAIQAVFRKARQARIIQHDPSESLEMPRSSQGRRRAVTDAERAWILEHAESHRAGLWVKMMLHCGLRPGECIALRWGDIDSASKTVTVDKALKGGADVIGLPKTAAGARSVPVPDHFMGALEAARGKPGAPVFTQTDGVKRHTVSSFRKSWLSFLRQADIALGAATVRNRITESRIAPDLTPYCLRHTYCTDLEVAGVPINVAKYLMGHSDIGVTSRIYTHRTDAAVEAARGKINARAQAAQGPAGAANMG